MYVLGQLHDALGTSGVHLEDLVSLGEGHSAQLDVGAGGDVSAALLSQGLDLIPQRPELC